MFGSAFSRSSPSTSSVVGGFRTGSYGDMGTRPYMEDFLLSRDLRLKGRNASRRPRACLFAVFDGHSGEEAANYLQKNLAVTLESALNAVSEEVFLLTGEALDTLMKSTIAESFADLDEKLCATPSGVSGSCASSLVIMDSRLYCSNLGDSRVVLCRGGKAVVLSGDAHKPTNLDEADRIQKSGGFLLKGRVLGGLAVTRSFGDWQYKNQADLRRMAGLSEGDAISPLIIATPNINVELLKKIDDYVVLACDGLWGVLGNQEACDFISASLSTHGDPYLAAKALAVHAVKEKGSADNVSILIVLFNNTMGQACIQSAAEEETPLPVAPPLTHLDLRNPWRAPLIDALGWSIFSGPLEERNAAIVKFGIDTKISPELRRAWFDNHCPWRAAMTPRKWRLEKATLVSSIGVTTSAAVRLLKLSPPSFQFFQSHYEDVIILGGRRETRWANCLCVSPTVRLVRCVDGILSKEEAAFPYALLTLKSYTVSLAEVTNPDYADDGECSRVISETPALAFEFNSPHRGVVQFSLKNTDFKHLVSTGKDCWNLRSPFRLGNGENIGSHMSFIRLASSGRFLAIGAVELNAEAKEEVDRLTQGGNLLEAVIASHPFHTKGFQFFFEEYSPSSPGQTSEIQWISTPRHVKRLPQIPFAGDVSDPSILRRWETDGVFIRIPDGTAFVDPTPPSKNHLSGLFVYHSSSQTLHTDDCLCYFDHPEKRGLREVMGARPEVVHDSLVFHSSLEHYGVLPSAEAPLQFLAFMENILNDWPFNALATAHTSLLATGAHGRVRALLNETRPLLIYMAERNRRGQTSADDALKDLSQRMGAAALVPVKANSRSFSLFSKAAEPPGPPSKEGVQLTMAQQLRGAWSAGCSDSNCECG